MTALTWPQCKGVFGGCLGLSTDRLLVGRIDGSVAFVDILDSSTYRRQELEHCYRPDGEIASSLIPLQASNHVWCSGYDACIL